MAINKIELLLDEPLSYFETLRNTVEDDWQQFSDEAIKVINGITNLAQSSEIIKKYAEPGGQPNEATRELALELGKLYSGSNSLISRLVEEKVVSAEPGKEIDQKYLGDVFRHLDVATTVLDGMKLMWEHDSLERGMRGGVYRTAFQNGTVANKARIGVGSSLEKTVTRKEFDSMVKAAEREVRGKLAEYDGFLFVQFVRETAAKTKNGFDWIFDASYKRALSGEIDKNELRESARKRIMELTDGLDAKLPATELLNELDGRTVSRMELHETALTFAKDFALEGKGNCVVRMDAIIAGLEQLGREDMIEKLGVKLDNSHVWLVYDDGCNAPFEIGASGHKSDEKCPIEALIAANLGNTGFNLDYHLRNPAEAIKCYNEALVLNPYDAAIWNCKGVALKNLEKLQEAIKCYDTAIMLEPDYPDPWSNMGIAFDELGEFAKALKCYDWVLALEPDNWVVWNNRGDALRGLAKQKQQQQNDSAGYKGAIKSYAISLKLNPKSRVGWKSIGDVLADLGRTEKAIMCYDKAIELDPEYHGAWKKKGDALKGIGRFKEAARCYDVAKTLEIPAGVVENA